MTMPSEEHYRALIAVLRDANRAFDAAEDEKARLAATRQAMQGVMRYLWSDPEVVAGNLTRSLAVLRAAAYDASQGATVSMLEHSPTRPGKPTEMTREVVQGTMAWALEMIVATKVGKERAVAWVASSARHLGVLNEEGSPIAGRQIESWRSEINRRKAPALACEVFEKLRRMPPNVEMMRRLREERSPTAAENAKQLVALLIKSVATAAPQSAPKQTRRA
jgi:hypothetical protein